MTLSTYQRHTRSAKISSCQNISRTMTCLLLLSNHWRFGRDNLILTQDSTYVFPNCAGITIALHHQHVRYGVHEQLHEAGYDAFLTAQVFLALAGVMKNGAIVPDGHEESPVNGIPPLK